jgi:hypothetical protein
VSNNKIKYALVAGGLLAAATPASAQTTLFGTTHTISVYNNGGPDGVAAGDMDGDGRPEIAYNLRRGRDLTTQGASTDSSLVVYGVNGSTWTRKFQVNTSNLYVGFPSFGDFNGDGLKEVAACDLANGNSTSSCKVFGATGTELTNMRVDNLTYATNTNGGPSVADLNEDGYDDLVISTYGGKVIFKPGNNAAGWTYDLFANHADWLFGTAAIGDLFNDGHQQIVVGGAGKGSLYIISRTGVLSAVSLPQFDAATQKGWFFYGSGPALGNLDTDANLEVAAILDYSSLDASLPGPRLVVYELTPTSATITGSIVLPATTSFTTPVIGDITGDGKPEIVLLDNKGTVRVYNYTGGNLVALGSGLSVDTASWSSPALYDIDGDGDLEIAATGAAGAYLVASNASGALTKSYTWSAASANVFPQPIIVDADGDTEPEMFTGSWSPARVVAIDLPFSPATAWSALGRSAKHQGSITTGSELIGDDVARELAVLMTQLEVPPSGCTASDLATFATAFNYVEVATRKYLSWTPYTALTNLRDAQTSLAGISTSTCYTSLLRERAARIGVLLFRQFIDRSAPVLGYSSLVVSNANVAYTTAKAQLSVSNWSGALATARSGTNPLASAVNAATTVNSTTCSNDSTREPYLVWECSLLELNSAVTSSNLVLAMTYEPDLTLASAIQYARAAVLVASPDPATLTDAQKKQAALVAQQQARLYLDDVKQWFQRVDPTGIAAAESYYTQGVTEMNKTAPASHWATAMARFRTAVQQAKPCTNAGDGVVGDVACLP